MSLWEFRAVIGGWSKAHGAEDANALTTEEARSLASALDAPPVWH